MRVTITTGVWGEKYRQVFADYSIASLLAPGNLPAIAKKHQITFQIVTARKDVRWLWSNANIQRIEQFATLDLVLIEDRKVHEPNKQSKYKIVTRLQNIAINSAQPNDALIFNYADFVWSDGSLPNAVALLGDEMDAVLSFCPPIELSGGCAALDTRRFAGLLQLGSRELADLCASHLHREASYRYWDAAEFTRFPSYLLFRVGDQGFVIRAYHQTALVLRVKPGDRHPITGTLDGDFTSEIASRGRVVHADDSDAVMVVSLHDGPSSPHARGGDRTKTLREFIAARADASQRTFAATPLRVKCNFYDPALWAQVERESGERRIVMPLAPDVAPVVNIQVARTCNLRCTFCSHNVWAEPTGFMAYDLFQRVIASLEADGCKTVCFVSAQGESLLHPKIFSMLAECLEAGFETNLVTNGTPLNEKRISVLAALDLDSIQFSFAGWDKDSYERAYVGARFEQVSRNLKKLIAALRGSRTTLSINGVLSERDGFERTTAYLLTLGARASEIRLQLPHNWGGTVETPFAAPARPGKVCPLLISTPGIYVDGRVTACGCIDANGALEIGTIQDHSLAELRRGEKYRSMVQAFADGDLSGLPLCAKCEVPYL